MKKIIIPFIIFLFYHNFITAQSNPGNIGPSSYEVQLVPSNPDVANLGKFGTIPVNKYNGTANISIPIHSIELDGLDIPITLSYNTSGIRVNQDASWVGLGWNLSDGIVITREVNGFEDIKDLSFSNDHVGWLFSDELLFPVFPETQFILDADELWALHQDYQINTPPDLQPDLFSVNLPGGAFKFYLPKISGSESELEGLVIGERNYKVIYNISNQIFEVIDPNGFTYFFDQKEFSTSYHSQNDSGGTSNELTALRNVLGTAALQSLYMISSWKVSKITSPFNDATQDNAVLNFSYTPGFFVSFPNFSETYDLDVNHNSVTGSGPASNITLPSNINATLTAFNTLYLNEISGSFGAVRFVLGERDDLFSREAKRNMAQEPDWNIGVNPNNESSKRLEAIDIVDPSNQIVKKAQFNYGYFNENYDPQEVKEKYIRLKLDNISVLDQVYSFEYESPNELPARDTKSTDFWGFYNGISNNIRIPSFNRFFLIHPSAATDNEANEGFFKRNGANRKSDINYGKIGILTKVIYPTGGSAELEYEANRITLKERTYTPTFRTNGNFRSSGLRSSAEYDFRYQQLKLAEDPTYTLFDNANITCDVNTSSAIGTNSPFTITDTSLCNGQTFNIEISATLSCTTGCNIGINPTGRAVWIENVQTGEETTIFSYDSQFNVNTTTVNLSERLNLSLGDYRLHSTAWTNISPLVVATTTAAAIIWHEASIDPPTDIYEEFEVGGARIKKITNKDSDGSFISSKEFTYDHIIENGIASSSGILMDDLIFWSTGSSLFEYSPEILTSGNGNKFFISSDNKVRSNNSALGSHIGYSMVTEQNKSSSETGNGKIVSIYVNKPNEYILRNIALSQVNVGNGTCQNGNGNPYFNIDNLDCFDHYDVGYGEVYILGASPNTYDYLNGKIIEETINDTSGNPIQKTLNTYSEFNGGIVPFTMYPIMYWVGTGFPITDTHHKIRSTDLNNRKLMRIKKSISTSYFSSGEINKTVDYFYENPAHYLLTKTETTDSQGELLTAKAFYPQDLQSEPFMVDLIAQNRMNNQIKTESFKSLAANPLEVLINRQTSVFDNSSSLNNLVLPKEIITQKGNETTNEVHRIIYEKYDGEGNLLQYKKPEGTTISFVRGYNNMYPVAKIVHATFDQVIATGINLGTIDNSASSDTSMRAELDIIRQGLPNAMVTTYTYDPLIGVTSITDPRGYTIYYEYDEFNRLKMVKDADGNIVSKNEYNYKNN